MTTLMTRLSCLALSLLSIGGLAASASWEQQPAPKTTGDSAVRFEAVDIFVDSGEEPLAAYQFELKAPQREGYEAIIVGVEGGEHAAYQKAPYYDPAALQNNRIIIAAYSVDQQLPKGKTRVARLHMQLRPVDAAKDAADKKLAQLPSPATATAPPAAPGRPAAPGGTAGAARREAERGLAAAEDDAASKPTIAYSVELITAASPSGAATPATISVVPGGNP